MDEKIHKILLSLIEKNKGNSINSASKGIVKLINCGVDLVTIDTNDKCAYFHGDFPRLAPKIPQLESFIEYLKQENYQTNLD